jgi:hypothetical protein
VGKSCVGRGNADLLVGFGEEGLYLRGGLGAWTQSALFCWTLGARVCGGGDAFGDGFRHCGVVKVEKLTNESETVATLLGLPWLVGNGPNSKVQEINYP